MTVAFFIKEALMATKQLNSRIQWKRDTSANWEANNPVLLDGEIIIVTTNAGETRFKVGDGVKTYTQLPFQDEAVRALITELSATVDTKLTTPNGTAGQLLGYTADNVVGAVDASVSLFNAKYSSALLSKYWFSTPSNSPYAYKYSISLRNIQDDLFFIYPIFSTNQLRKQMESYFWDMIQEITLSTSASGANIITFYASEKPLVNLSYTIIYNGS